MTIPVFELRDRLTKARSTAGYTQAELADKLHVTRATLNRYETGQRTPSEDVVKAVAEATGVPLSWFYAADSPATQQDAPPQRITIEVSSDGARIIE